MKKMLAGRRAALVLIVVGVTALSVQAQPAAQAESRLDRGRYLMSSIVACGSCHTPQGPKGPLPGMELAGGLKFEEKPFTAYASNITPDKETGIGKWTDAQLVRAIREGKPVSNAVAKSEYRMPLPPVGRVADISPKDKIAYGKYLAGPAGHCIKCHSSPGAKGGPDIENKLGAGGFPFTRPWGVSVSTNITPTGLAKYSDAGLKKVITTGVRPDGSKLKPPMAVSYYANMKEAGLDALVAYLRTLPPK